MSASVFSNISFFGLELIFLPKILRLKTIDLSHVFSSSFFFFSVCYGLHSSKSRTSHIWYIHIFVVVDFFFILFVVVNSFDRFFFILLYLHFAAMIAVVVLSSTLRYLCCCWLWSHLVAISFLSFIPPIVCCCYSVVFLFLSFCFFRVQSCI